jgi:hypothetical protein
LYDIIALMNKIHRILEIGCSAQPFFLIGLRQLEPHEEYTGVEISPINLCGVDIPGATFIQADATEPLPLEPGFQEIIMSNVWCDGSLPIRNKILMGREACRLLAPCGELTIVETYSTQNMPYSELAAHLGTIGLKGRLGKVEDTRKYATTSDCLLLGEYIAHFTHASDVV